MAASSAAARRGSLPVALDASELGARALHARSGPAQRYLTVAPALHLAEQLDEAFAAAVIEPAGGAEEYRFTHALMQQALLAELMPGRRVRLHSSIAEALDELYGARATAHAAELAQHYLQAAVLSPDHARQAARYSRLAAHLGDCCNHFECTIPRFTSAPPALHMSLLS